MVKPEHFAEELDSPPKRKVPTTAREYFKWLLQPLLNAVTSPVVERQITKKAQRAIEEYEQGQANQSRE